MSSLVGLPGGAGNSNPLGLSYSPVSSAPVSIGGQNVNATITSVDNGSIITNSGLTTGDLNNSINAGDLGQAINDVFGTSIGNAASSLLGVTPANSGSISTSAGQSSEVSDLFLRAVVVITGFIFVAVGLSGFNKK